MTDTTTITPEERAAWRERLESPLSCHDVPHRAFTLRLLTALEAAEARAEQTETELAHVRLAAGSDRYDEVTSDLIDALQKNEAENARLKWLIECMDNYEWCCNRSGWFIAHGVHHEAKATLEAARRAVAGEGEVK